MAITRRTLMKQAISAGAALAGSSLADALDLEIPQKTATRTNFASLRPPESKRKFSSRTVETFVSTVQREIIARSGDAELAWLFGNCFPNTLDTTVELSSHDGKPDTFVITGDIEAMWLRDSSAQVWSYLPLASKDRELRQLLEGVVRRQTRCILLDPYANAFMKSAAQPPLSWSVHDKTDMKRGVGERKWEIDSLCYPIRLAHGYWRQTKDVSPFDEQWHEAMRLVVRTFREQQRKEGRGPYSFLRETTTPNDTLNLNGYGNPARPVGMIFSGFRPSDDACVYPLFVPAILFAVLSLRQLAEMLSTIRRDNETARECRSLADEVEAAILKYGKGVRPGGEIWAYEVDGYGNQLFMDDANTPGLLGLPYLGCCAADDPLYLRTRAFILSDSNPYFFRGKAAEGVGGPHTGYDTIWPMSIIMRGLTSTSASEVARCVEQIRATHAGKGFIHESFHKDDASKYTRDWFAWGNSLFGELVIKNLNLKL